MIDAPILSALYIPDALLERLANRDFSFVLQRYHFIVRLLHILSASAFFGAVALLDLRLMGWRTDVPAKHAAALLPFLHAAFWTAMATGLILFFYAPVQVGSHAYFAPKLIALAAGMLNVGVYNHFGLYRLTADPLPARVRLCGGLSLLCWVGVMAFSSLNAESVPKVILR